MEGPAAALRRRSSAARPSASPRAAQRRGRAPDRLPRRPRAAATARASRHLALAAGRRAGAAGRRARVDRAARLDRDRRPLALVPLPRAADRAPARARRCPPGATNRTQPIDGRDVLEFLAARRDARRGADRPLLGHRRARTSMSYEELLERIAERRCSSTAPRSALRLQPHPGRLGRRRRDRRRGPGADRAADGVARTRPAAARRRRRRGASACACTASKPRSSGRCVIGGESSRRQMSSKSRATDRHRRARPRRSMT